MQSISRWMPALLSAVLISGCATHGRVDKNMILPDSAPRVVLESHQAFLIPTPIETPLPEFPENTRKNLADTTICASFAVSADGEVSDIQPLDQAEDCVAQDSAEAQLLYPQVRSALARWSFFGGAICSYEKSEAECDQADAKLQPTAVRLAYRFRFAMVNGKRSVQAERTTGNE